MQVTDGVINVQNLQIGDIVTRKSYAGDMFFRIINIMEKQNGKKVCVLKGVLYRIEADADMDDLSLQDAREVFLNIHREMAKIRMENSSRGFGGIIPVFSWFRGRAGRILHVDSSQDFMQRCVEYYREAGIRAIGKTVKESEQPRVVRKLLEQAKPDILILTGHDSLKKNAASRTSLDNYSNSRYYIEAVKAARKYEPDMNKLCIFAGACQSFFEAIMAEGANFASSPGRVLIHALDPAIVSEKVALTDSRKMVTPDDVVPLTKSGSKGIGGVDTRGHFVGR